MPRFPKTATVALSAAALGLVVAACQPQGGPAATDEPAAAAATAAAAGDATADDMASDVLGAAEIGELFVGNTIIGELDAWKLTWAEYFAPDGTAQAVLRFEGQDDTEITGTHYANDQDEFCTEYPEIEGDQKVFCHKIFPLGDGRYQQLYADGTRGSIYNQILEGEQLDAFR